MTTANASTEKDSLLARAILEQVVGDLAMIIDRPLVMESVECERSGDRLAAEGGIQISFRQEYEVDGRAVQGCLLVPLAEAISIAAYLMVMSDEDVRARRSDQDLDRETKDAILEVSNFIGGSADQVLRDGTKGSVAATARSAGCQGVAEGDVPNFRHGNGEPLIVARVRMKLHDFDPFEVLCMLPAELLADGPEKASRSTSS